MRCLRRLQYRNLKCYYPSADPSFINITPCDCADDDKRLAKAADEGRLRRLRKEAQRESRLAKKKLQRQQDQDGRGTEQKPSREARGWASDEEEFKETLPRTDSGQAGVWPDAVRPFHSLS